MTGAGHFRSNSRAVAAVRAFALVALTLCAAGASAPALARQSAEDASQLEALVETTKGDFVIRFFPDKAPKHVAHFVATARKGGFDRTTFHRAIPYGIIQGGDPLSKEPSKKSLYGTGGLKLLPDEISDLRHFPGAVSAVALPGPGGDPIAGSTGTQFFVCDRGLQGLDGKYTVFARVTRGMDVVRAISVLPTQGDKLVERVEIKKVTIRPLTPTVEQMRATRLRVQTDRGEIVFELLPDAAPENARNFANLASEGYYDGLTLYRAVPGFVLQGGNAAGWPADHPNTKRAFSVWPVKDEFTTAVMDRGLVGMAHASEPNSATVHFFFLLGRATQLDNAFTAFGRVVSGLDVAEKIVAEPVTGDKLNAPVVIRRIVVEGGKAPATPSAAPQAAPATTP